MQEVTIELGGKQRRLALNLNADIALQEEIGETLGELLQAMQRSDADAAAEAAMDPAEKRKMLVRRNLERTKAVRSLLWASVQADAPGVTVNDVGSWVTAGNLVPVMEALGACVKAMAGGDEFEGQLAPFVPTPDAVVQAMIRMAGITDDSLVMDMGAGDGRLLFAAHAAAVAVVAVGYELHPGRHAALVDRIHSKGLGHAVTVCRSSIQEALERPDVGQADVVFLYLLDSSNMLLRDKLRAAMKPGARIISHDFAMGDWAPDATETVIAERPHKVYRWVI